jgi:uncharacterized protein (TIGR03435 family)
MHLRIAIAILLNVSAAFSQTDAVFDVASIKPSDTGTRQALVIQPGGRFVATSFTLQALVAIAYHLTPFEMSKMEGWIADDRWNIEAKAEGVAAIPSWVPPTIPEMMAVRLRALLEDRFSLKVHRETRVQQVYVLTVAKGGSKLVTVDPASASQQETKQRPGSFRAGPGIVIGAAVNMDQIVKYLDRLMDRQVVDRTGLAGYYDMTLKFAPESAPRFVTPSPPAGAEPQVSAEASIFAALTEQLGLKLQSAKEPSEFLVVDSAKKPTAN